MTTDYVKTPINFISFAFLLTIFSAANLYSRIFLLVPGKTQKNANWNHVHYYKHLLFGYRKRPKWCCIEHVFITSIWFLFFGFFPNLCISTNDSDVQFMQQKKATKKWRKNGKITIIIKMIIIIDFCVDIRRQWLICNVFGVNVQLWVAPVHNEDPSCQPKNDNLLVKNCISEH